MGETCPGLRLGGEGALGKRSSVPLCAGPSCYPPSPAHPLTRSPVHPLTSVLSSKLRYLFLLEDEVLSTQPQPHRLGQHRGNSQK